MKQRAGLLRVLVLMVVVFSAVYLCFALYVARKALYPDWYRPQTSQEQAPSRQLTPCSGYQKAAYIYCTNPSIDLNMPYQDVEGVRSVFGRNIAFSGWWIKASGNTSASKSLVVLVHGGGADRRAMLKHASYLTKAGYDVLDIDCQNHGIAPNNARGISFGVWESESVLAAYDWARTQQYQHIAAMGTSQGAVAVLLAASKQNKKDHFAAVIAENPYFSLMQLRWDLPWKSSVDGSTKKFVLAALSFWHGTDLFELDASVYAPRIGSPVFLIHGSDDRVVDSEHSQALLALLPGPKDFWLVPYGDHELLWNKFRDQYEKRVLEFLNQYISNEISSGS